MNPTRFFLFIFFSLSIFSVSPAQTSNRFLLTGRIIDSETKQPVKHVEVFVSGTTSGCISDENGYFRLKIPYLPCTVVAQHVSYKSFIKPIEKCKETTIELSPSNFKIDEVGVTGKNKRKKNLRFFLSHFIPDNRNKIKIVNDSALFFERDKMKFRAFSKRPLIIMNDYLGYKISMILDEFEVIQTDGPTGRRLPLNSLNGGEIMQLTAYYFFESMEDEFPEKKEMYESNRIKSYFGSYRHFLKSIYDQNSEEEGYQIDIFPKTDSIAFFVGPINEQTGNKEMYILADSLKVHYYYMDDRSPIPLEYIYSYFYVNTQVSTIYPNKQRFIVRPNGTSPKLPFVIDGLLVTKSFANTLPWDYVPPQKERKKPVLNEPPNRRQH